MNDRALASRDATGTSRSVAELLQATATHTENVLRGEVRLAVARAQEKLSAKARSFVPLIIACVLGFCALLLLLVATTLLLNRWLDAWLATGVVGAVVALAAWVTSALPTNVSGGSS